MVSEREKSGVLRGGLALLGAFVVHLALLESGRRLPPIETWLGGPPHEQESALALVEIDTDDSTPAAKESPPAGSPGESPPAAESPSPEPRGSRPEAPAGVAGAASPAVDDAKEDTTRAPSEHVSPALANDPSPGSLPASPPREARGEASTGAPSPDEYDTVEPARPASPFGGAPLWTLPGVVPATRAEAAPTTTPGRAPLDRDVANRVLASTMRSRDKTSGLTVPAAGLVASTAAAATRAVAVPHNTRATFEVKLGPGGKVMGARVVSSSAGEAAAWDAAARNVAASLGKQNLSLGSAGERSGVTVRVNVTLKHVFASGTAKRADIKPVCANGVLNEIIDAADTHPSGDSAPKVPLFQDEHGRPCIPVGVGGISDVANLDSQKQIAVETSYQVVFPGGADLPVEMAPVNTDAPWVDTGKAGPRPTLPQAVRKKIRDHEKRK